MPEAVSVVWTGKSRALELAGEIEVGAEEVELLTLRAAYEESQQRVPVGGSKWDDPHPGQLKDSGEVRPEEHAIVYTAPYASFVEFGTRNMAAEPFLMPSVDGQRLPFLTRLARLFH
jgi:hypothetical protein